MTHPIIYPSYSSFFAQLRRLRSCTAYEQGVEDAHFTSCVTPRTRHLFALIKSLTLPNIEVGSRTRLYEIRRAAKHQADGYLARPFGKSTRYGMHVC